MEGAGDISSVLAKHRPEIAVDDHGGKVLHRSQRPASQLPQWRKFCANIQIIGAMQALLPGSLTRYPLPSLEQRSATHIKKSLISRKNPTWLWGRIMVLSTRTLYLPSQTRSAHVKLCGYPRGYREMPFRYRTRNRACPNLLSAQRA